MKTALTLVFVSAASLAFQVALTRFFSLSQGHHFAFMAISLALLGIGASGTYLSLRRATATTWRRTFTAGTLLFTLSLPVAYLAINYLPFDAYQIAWDSTQFLWLALYYLALTVPFFFSGLVVGVALAAQPGQAGRVYGANLLGSGLGPPLALLAMAAIGGPGTVFFCTLLGWIGFVISWSSASRQILARVVMYALIPLTLLYLAVQPPALFEVQLTPYKALSQARLYPESRVVFSQWNAFSRVDVLQSKGIRSAPGLSFTYSGDIPPQLGLLIDGDNLAPIVNPTQPTFTEHLPLALAFQLRPAADVLILEPSGGLAVQTALDNGAGSVTVVQSNHTAVDAVTEHFAEFNQNLYADPRVELVVDEPRSYLQRTGQQYDLIILPLTDSFRPVTAGAYTLSEDYRYTVEAFVNAFAHLSPDGLIMAERWLQLPPSESLRLWATVVEAAARAAPENSPSEADREKVAALRSLQTSLVLAGQSPLSAEDLSAIRQFADEKQFDLIWLPDIQPEEANRYSIVPDSVYFNTFSGLLASPNATRYFADYPHDVFPPSDDRPFFFHFFKWQQTPQIFQSLGKTWQPFGGSGYLVLVILLVLVVILSAVLILLPLLWMRVENGQEQQATRLSRKGQIRYLLYFALLGLGFLFVEIPLLQRFILYLGQPAYAFAVVVSSLLVAAGLGSRFLTRRLPLRVAIVVIVVLILLYPLLLPYLFDATLWLPFTGRTAITAVVLFPLGLFLGVPFPKGVLLVGQNAPQLTPWMWAVNGCASVVSAVLAAMIALTWGFSVVLWGAAAAYGLAGLAINESTEQT